MRGQIALAAVLLAGLTVGAHADGIIYNTPSLLDQLKDPNYQPPPPPPPGPTIEAKKPVYDRCGMNYDCYNNGNETNPAEDLPTPEETPKTPEPVPDAD